MTKKYTIKSPTKIESLAIRTMILVGLVSILNFLFFFFRPEFQGYLPLYILLSIILIYGVLKKGYLWYHYFAISVPEKKPLQTFYKVDVLTTYFPGEPYVMIINTLEAIKNITYPHSTYLCDEADDDFLKQECERLGVIHVTRDNRIDAKAGNINNALRKATGEICLILDPDHVPQPNFLDIVLPHFHDEKIGYVQVVQAYYNKPHTLVARGASEQTFQFYGPMMMTMNSYGCVNAIGANCTFRRAALDSICGHAPGLAEDMHTSMLLHAKGWKSKYVPELVAKGLAPSDLGSYYKQQLKWSRGVFELLYSVYPKQFKNFSFRQKFHYALLPLHYLIGFIYLIGFLIPIVALLFSKMPWTGDILYFAIFSLPVLVSSLMIRTFIQKWVIEKNDRGFHIIGGLLQIITWWIFILGVTYTFVRKKVPYLPTPKSEGTTNIKIVIPNLIIAALSIFAMIYGLNRDLTPYSLIMAFFAGMNALFMFFSVYLASGITNRNQILRTALERKTIETLKAIKQKFIDLADLVFQFTRYLALPLLLISLLLSWYSLETLENRKWNAVASIDIKQNDMRYLGIFCPSGANGITDLDRVRQIEDKQNIDFQMVSLYVAWGNSTRNRMPLNYLSDIVEMGASPLITWEPWAAPFHQSDSVHPPAENQGIYKLILQGRYDNYIKEAAKDIGSLDGLVFLRFAHEFDNPFYPWSLDAKNTPENFRQAWQYVHSLFKELGVDNVQWVWNPWKPKDVLSAYPGDDYVDWLGVTLLNYGTLNSDGKWYSFDALYRPFNQTFDKLSDKPVMLAEFGSLKVGGNQKDWLREAFGQIDLKYPDIGAVIFFNSGFDKNIPKTSTDYQSSYLDWSIDDTSWDSQSYIEKFSPFVSTVDLGVNKRYEPVPLSKGIKGVNYKKSDNWFHNNYTASRDVLLKDFAIMRRIGINTVKYRSSDIYDQNVLKYAEDSDIQIIYSFEIPKNIDFAKDSEELVALQGKILSRVKKLRNKNFIEAWHLDTDSWWQISHRDFFMTDIQRKSYLSWLKDLTEAIKEIDPDRPLTKTVLISPGAVPQMRSIRRSGIAIDAFAIEIEDRQYLHDFMRFTDKENVPYFWGKLHPSDLQTLGENTANKAVVLRNWQNQWETGQIEMDGLLDFSGRKTQDFALAESYWVDADSNIDIPKFKILRPAVRLLSGNKAIYSAVVLQNDLWVYPDVDSDLGYKWRLVKYDDYGTIMAMKDLGNRPTVELIVPENYKQYGILLTLTKDGFSKTSETTLNTPAKY